MVIIKLAASFSKKTENREKRRGGLCDVAPEAGFTKINVDLDQTD